MREALKLVAIACAVVFAASCGPIESTAVVLEADAALEAAKAADAPIHAVYEYVSAEEYLKKAREEQAYAQYETAIDFAQKAREFAVKARQKSRAPQQSTPTGTPTGTP